MDFASIIIWLVLGALAGWLAGRIVKGGGFGLIGNIILGIVGSIVGGWLFGLLGLGVTGGIGSFIAAVVGAIVLIFVIGLVAKK